MATPRRIEGLRAPRLLPRRSSRHRAADQAGQVARVRDVDPVAELPVAHSVWPRGGDLADPVAELPVAHSVWRRGGDLAFAAVVARVRVGSNQPRTLAAVADLLVWATTAPASGQRKHWRRVEDFTKFMIIVILWLRLLDQKFMIQ